MSKQIKTADVPVFLLCGGLGTRIKEETEFRPKPMVPIGEHPILRHIMQIYARHGFRRFVLCLGFRADYVKDYFRNFHLHNTDCTINLKTNAVEVHEVMHDVDWEVTLAYTGEKNMTGSRIAQATRKYLGDAEHFAVTYGDGLTDANLTEEFKHHLARKKIGTVLGVFILRTMRNGIVLIGVPGLAYNIFIGAIILGMMSLHSWLDRRERAGG